MPTMQSSLGLFLSHSPSLFLLNGWIHAASGSIAIPPILLSGLGIRAWHLGRCSDPGFLFSAACVALLLGVIYTFRLAWDLCG
ncbi:Uncharacterized protein TCM_019802 [Theobroma cacao]|uniref:Uncharacterized protein n=1 Tax=Theobroma cacao TaxID=3641 RepID=A0A061EJJ1_THECC|nr:Uncharacterized protein TCM_019802 [Theobroma cacao]